MGGNMRKYAVMILALLIINSCHKDRLPNQDIQDQKIKTLTDQLIYGEEEESRIKALNDLTRIDIKVRYDALNKFISAMESNPELFPKEKADEADGDQHARSPQPGQRHNAG